jgi:hypothetical protein
MGSTEYKRGSRAIARGQWQAPLGSSRGKPPDHGQPAAVLALVKGKPFGGAEEAPSVTVTVRDGATATVICGRDERMLAARVEQRMKQQSTTKMA